MAGENMLDNQNNAGGKDKEEKLVKYKVKNTCYWEEKLYRAGDTVELPESAKPPVGDKGHFVKL
jgi:hypothetical protein